MSPEAVSLHEEWSADHGDTGRAGNGGANKRWGRVTNATGESRGPGSGSGYWEDSDDMVLPGRQATSRKLEWGWMPQSLLQRHQAGLNMKPEAHTSWALSGTSKQQAVLGSLQTQEFHPEPWAMAGH